MPDQDKTSGGAEKEKSTDNVNNQPKNPVGLPKETEEKKKIVEVESHLSTDEEGIVKHKAESENKSDISEEEKESSKEKAEVPVAPEQAEGKEKIIEKKVDQQQAQVAKDDDQDQDEEKDKKQVKEHAKEISTVQDADEQIDKLVNLAMQKDPYTAIKVAKELDNNYILDKVHDELIEDKTRKILLEKGLLEE